VKSCTICARPDHGAIADAIADALTTTGRPRLREIATQFGVSKSALHRHYQHLLAVEAPEESPAQGTVTLPHSEPRSWTFPKWVWRQVWGRKGVLALVAGGIGYMVRGFTCQR
jgi:hypothetical protein